jgi:Mycothiol maleylpyruvate isomerase N-terminal domain
METPENRVQLIRSTSRQFGQYLHALPAASWNQPSAGNRWEVRDVVGHLILGAELYFGIVSRGLHGDTSPPEGFPQAGTVNATSVATFVDQMSVTRRENLGDQLLATFATTSGQLHQVLAQCRSHDWERLC